MEMRVVSSPMNVSPIIDDPCFIACEEALKARQAFKNQVEIDHPTLAEDNVRAEQIEKVHALAARAFMLVPSSNAARRKLAELATLDQEFSRNDSAYVALTSIYISFLPSSERKAALVQRHQADVEKCRHLGPIGFVPKP